MHNIASIYRFYTPFLDFSLEKKNLLSVIKKIEKSIEFDWLKYNRTISLEWNYNKIVLDLEWWLWKIELYYISKFDNNYYLPLFTLDVFIDIKLLSGDKTKKNTVSFLNNIFECFDWLNEKEFLIDIDSNFYFRESLFKKTYPSYDFINIESIEDEFNNWNGIKLLEDFIIKFKDKNFILTKENSQDYHKIHWVLLYFIYLVFLISETLEETDKTKEFLNSFSHKWKYEWQVEFMNKRLSYVDEVNKNTFEKYKNSLDLFFKLF